MHIFIRIMHGWIPGCVVKCMEVYKGAFVSKYISA